MVSSLAGDGDDAGAVGEDEGVAVESIAAGFVVEFFGEVGGFSEEFAGLAFAAAGDEGQGAG